MIEGRSVLALVPARGGSKGLPRKNLRQVGGLPLVAWPIRAAKAARVVDRVVVSTDDAEIAAVAREAGADVPFMRPAELASDVATTPSVVSHALTMLAAAGDNYDYVTILEPTSPLTDANDVERALALLDKSRDRADAIVGIAAMTSTHPEYAVVSGENGIIKPYAVSDFSRLRRRQDIPKLHFLDGTLYASSVEAFHRHGTYYHERTMGYVVPRWKSFEIDDLVDLICIEALLARRAELDGSA